MLIKARRRVQRGKTEKSVKAVSNALGMMGYTDAMVTRRERRDTDKPGS